MSIATEPTRFSDVLVRLVVLSEPPAIPGARPAVLVHYVDPAEFGGPSPSDGEPTWEDAAWY